MPLPPTGDETEDVKLNFSHAECLLFTFHQICRHQPEFLTSEDNAEKLKDFRTRSVSKHLFVVNISYCSWLKLKYLNFFEHL